MNELKIFENEAFGQIRAMEKGGEPWFFLADVCKALEIGNPSDVKKRLGPKGGRYYRYPYTRREASHDIH